VNHAPSFALKPHNPPDNPSANDFDGGVSVPAMAKDISPGPASEAGQTVTFTVDNNSHRLFLVQPDCRSTGTLTFSPKPNAHGVAIVSIQAKDSGGTANGGVDTSGSQTFNITIIKPHRWHNTLHAYDVNDNGQVVPGDALAIINYLNTFGPKDVV